MAHHFEQPCTYRVLVIDVANLAQGQVDEHLDRLATCIKYVMKAHYILKVRTYRHSVFSFLSRSRTDVLASAKFLFRKAGTWQV